MKIHPLGTELFYADGQTDRHDEANSRVFERAYEMELIRMCVDTRWVIK
jgi:hypothetical protein